MKILAIESSTARGSLALTDDGKVIVEEGFYSERGHNTAIFGPLERILEGNREGIGRIVVGTGPGSYSGVRVGIAVANALGLTFKIPVVGIPSLLAPAALEAADYSVIGDARRRSWFLATVRGRSLSGEIQILEAGEFEARLAALFDAGEVLVTFDEEAPEFGGRAGILTDSPCATRLADRVGEMKRERLEALAGEPLQPVYLRAPFITTPKKK